MGRSIKSLVTLPIVKGAGDDEPELLINPLDCVVVDDDSCIIVVGNELFELIDDVIRIVDLPDDKGDKVDEAKAEDADDDKEDAPDD